MEYRRYIYNLSDLNLAPCEARKLLSRSVYFWKKIIIVRMSEWNFESFLS